MAKNRVINTKFWTDPYVQGLEPEEKLLYLYLISNSHTEICGVYEITLTTISFESGLSVQVVKKCLGKFEADRKIYHLKGLYIYIKNFSKHQQKNPSIDEGVKRSLNLLPPEITAMISHVDSLGTDCASDPHLNLNSTLTKPEPEPKGFVPDRDDSEKIHSDLGEESPPPKVPRAPPPKKELSQWTEDEAKANPVHFLIAEYEDYYQKAHGFRPKIPWEKHVKVLKEYGKELEIARKVMKAFFTVEDTFYEETNHDIAVFCSYSTYNKIKAELVKANHPVILKHLGKTHV